MTIYIWRNQVKRNDCGVQCQYATFLIGQTFKRSPFLIASLNYELPKFSRYSSIEVDQSDIKFEPAPEILKEVLKVDFVVHISAVQEFHDQPYHVPHNPNNW